VMHPTWRTTCTYIWTDTKAKVASIGHSLTIRGSRQNIITPKGERKRKGVIAAPKGPPLKIGSEEQPGNLLLKAGGQGSFASRVSTRLRIRISTSQRSPHIKHPSTALGRTPGFRNDDSSLTTGVPALRGSAGRNPPESRTKKVYTFHGQKYARSTAVFKLVESLQSDDTGTCRLHCDTSKRRAQKLRTQ